MAKAILIGLGCIIAAFLILLVFALCNISDRAERQAGYKD
jgi:hypothetical protein